MNRHSDWCVVVCLIGTGQEINRGEAGLQEWFRALGEQFQDWVIYASPKVAAPEQVVVKKSAALHLDVSIRSFRSERVSDFVAAVIHGNAKEAATFRSDLTSYPILITRDLERARQWLRSKARGTERFGLVASSNALRLRPFGLHMKSRVDVTNWFLSDASDVRSSMALEDAASEFEVQGLELAGWVSVGTRTSVERTRRGAITASRERLGLRSVIPSGAPIWRTRTGSC
jgi:hypothetical protein